MVRAARHRGHGRGLTGDLVLQSGEFGDEGGVVHSPGRQPVFLGVGVFSLCQGSDEVTGLASADLDTGAAHFEIHFDAAEARRIEIEPVAPSTSASTSTWVLVDLNADRSRPSINGRASGERRLDPGEQPFLAVADHLAATGDQGQQVMLERVRQIQCLSWMKRAGLSVSSMINANSC